MSKEGIDESARLWYKFVSNKGVFDVDGKDAPIVERIARSLNRTERHVLALYYCEELTPNEIGLVLDLPENRVVKILWEIREHVRHALERFRAPEKIA